MEKIKNNSKLFFILFLAASAAVIWYAVFYFEARQNLLITFFDVGQGDAIFIEIPNGNQILIDGGPGDTILGKLGRTMPFWDRSIDMLILTHPHADHLGGLLEVLKRYNVGIVLTSGAEHSIPEYQEWTKLLKEKGVNTVIAKAGQRIDAGSGAALDVLTPFEDFSGQSLKNPHDATVVTRLVHGENSILFMGDAERPLEYRLLFEYLNSQFIILNSRIIKVGHHGSKTSTSEEFLRVVSPEVTVIQVGRKNRYGHPTQEVLERLALVGAKVFRNDLDGDIIIESTGIGLIYY